MIGWLEPLGAGAAVTLLAGAGVEVYRRWAVRHQVLDLPVDRSSHALPTPRGGGIVTAAIVIAAAALTLGSHAGRAAAGFAAGGLLVAGVGWWDDLRSLPAAARLAVQAAAAGLVLWSCGWWSSMELPFAGPVTLGWVGLPLALLWLVGATNAFNFMDGIDGIAGLQGLLAGVFWAALGWNAGLTPVWVIGGSLAAGCAGFLFHNWHPARIFMGDAGSGFIGFTLASLPFAARAAGAGAGATDRLPVAALLVLWPFIWDTAYTLSRRLRRGENLAAAHRSHLYQRLVISGMRHDRTALLYGALALAGCLTATMWLTHSAAASPAAALLLVVGGAGLISGVVLCERRSLHRSGS